MRATDLNLAELLDFDPAGGPIHFKPRLLQGVPPVDRRPDELLLDGQQRMTSLYQSFVSSEPGRTILNRSILPLSVTKPCTTT